MPRTVPAHRDQGPLTKILGGVAFFAAVVLVLALPLVCNTQALDPFRGPKRDLALAAWATLAAVFVVSNARGRAWADSWWALWGGVLVGGAVSAVASGHFVRVLASLLPLLLAALGWGALRQLSEPQRAKLTKLVVWAGVIQAAAVLAFLNPSWQPTSFAELNLEGGRYAFIGSLGNPADVAVFLLLPAMLAVQRVATVRRSRWLYAAVALLLVGVIVATRTLTVIAALAVGLAVLAWLTAPRRYRVRVLASGAALLVVLVVATPLRGRVAQALQETRLAGGIWIGSGRAAGYAAAASMLAARPLTGVGFDQFEANSFRFQSLTALAERGKVLHLETAFGEAHDDLLQYGAETGLAGLALAAAGLGFAWRRRQRGGGTVSPAAPLLAAAFAVLVTQFPLHLAAISAQWAVLAAFVLPPLPTPPVPSRRTAEFRLAFALTLAALASLVAWQRYEARVAMGQARQLALSLRGGSASAVTRAQVARAALPYLLSKALWLPDSWEAHLVVGNVAVEARDQELALKSFTAALAMVERPEVQFDVGMALLLAGDQEPGMAHLVRAVELNPAFFHEIKDPEMSRSLRRHLDALGYGTKQEWMYEGTPAANP